MAASFASPLRLLPACVASTSSKRPRCADTRSAIERCAAVASTMRLPLRFSSRRYARSGSRYGRRSGDTPARAATQSLNSARPFSRRNGTWSRLSGDRLARPTSDSASVSVGVSVPSRSTTIGGWPAMKRTLRRHPVDHVVLARVLDDFQPDLVAADRLRHLLVLDLDRVDALAEVAGMADDVDHLADGERHLEPHRRDHDVTVVVRHDPDPDLARRGTADRRFDGLGFRPGCGLCGGTSRGGLLRRRGLRRRLPRRRLLEDFLLRG